MKALLTVPPTRNAEKPAIVVPPLGLLYIAGVAIKSGHEIEFIDAAAEGFSWDEFERKVNASNAPIAGVGAMTPIWDVALRAIDILKKAGKKVVVGGPHPTMRSGKFFEMEKNCGADFAVVGEGEKSFTALLNKLDKNESADEIAGIVTRQSYTPAATPEKNIDALPLPARHLLKDNLYSYPMLGSGKATTLFTSRGCPYACVFCDKSVFGASPRLHSADRVLEELQDIVCGRGIKFVIIYDDLFTVDRTRAMEICRKINERGLKFQWKCEGRVDNVDPELLAAMKSSGCKIVAYGIETANDAGLKTLRKGAASIEAANAIAETRNAGMDVVGYFLVGIPGETIEDVRRTARFAATWGVTWAQFSVLSPVEGTDLWKDACGNGWLANVDAMNPFDADLKRPAVLDGYWTEQKLKTALRLAHRDFYARPGYVLSRLKSAGGIKGAAGLVKRGAQLAGWMLRRRSD